MFVQRLNRSSQLESPALASGSNLAPFLFGAPSAACTDTRDAPGSAVCPTNDNTLLGLPTGVDPRNAYVISYIAFCMNLP